jgi:dolichol-phosphate mannosyltransferase
MVVDDNSPDKTIEAVEKLQTEYKNLYLIKRLSKMGVASAYIEGYEWGLRKEYKFLGQMDADLSHRIRDLQKLMKSLINYPELDLVIGSRWIFGGKTENWPIQRILLSKLGNKYIKLMLNLGIEDSTAGFRIYSRNILQTINLNSLKSEGFSFQVEMLRKVLESKGSILEIPIVFRERIYGYSKITIRIIIEAYIYVTKAGLVRLKSLMA